MAEELKITGESKTERYEGLYRQIEAVLESEDDEIANMANISAMISGTFSKGVCGTARNLTHSTRQTGSGLRR